MAAAVETALAPLAVRLEMDHYYADRTADGAAFQDALLVAHVAALRQGEAIRRPTYDWRQGCRTGELLVRSRPVLLVEGVRALTLAALRPLIDLPVWIEAADYTRISRLLRRDYPPDLNRDALIRELIDTWWPAHEREVAPGRRWAAAMLNSDGQSADRLAELLADLIRGALIRRDEKEDHHGDVWE